MSIEEGKLVAKFMNINVADFKWKDFHSLVLCDENGEWDFKYLEHFNPDSDWNQLMPVVEKIEAILDPHHGHFGVHIVSNSCTIQATNLRLDKQIAEPPHYFAYWYGDTKLQATWIAVTQFLTWYNKTKY